MVLIFSDELKEKIETNSIGVLKEQVICLAMKPENTEVQKAEAVKCQRKKGPWRETKEIQKIYNNFYSNVACGNST